MNLLAPAHDDPDALACCVPCPGSDRTMRDGCCSECGAFFPVVFPARVSFEEVIHEVADSTPADGGRLGTPTTSGRTPPRRPGAPS